MLSDALAFAMESYDFSGVKVYCDKTMCKEAIAFFEETYSELWKEAQNKVEEEYGSCEYSDEPILIREEDYGFLIKPFDELEVRYSYGDMWDPIYSEEAFDNSLKKLKENFPSIEYQGYMGYILRDIHGEQAASYEYYSGKKRPKTYDIIGEKLGEILSGDPEDHPDFWETLSEHLDWFNEPDKTINIIKSYKKWIKKEDLEKALTKIEEIQ